MHYALTVKGHRLRYALRLQIAAQDFALDNPLAVSIGISSFQTGDSRETLIARADQAMYRAKHQGRNQVCGSE